MNSQPVETKEPMATEITDEQIQQLVSERTTSGATSCRVVTENNQRFLVCRWPSLESVGGGSGIRAKKPKKKRTVPDSSQ